MTTERLLEQEPTARDVPQQAALAQIEQIIDRSMARYLTGLRRLSEEFGRAYDAQLTAKDAQLAAMRQRLEAAEGARDALAAQLDANLATLRSLSQELSRHLESSPSTGNPTPARMEVRQALQAPKGNLVATSPNGDTPPPDAHAVQFATARTDVPDPESNDTEDRVSMRDKIILVVLLGLAVGVVLGVIIFVP